MWLLFTKEQSDSSKDVSAVTISWFFFLPVRLMTKLVYCTSDQTPASCVCDCMYVCVGTHLEEVAGKEICLCGCEHVVRNASSKAHILLLL